LTILRCSQSWIGYSVWFFIVCFLLARADFGQTASVQIAVRALDQADAWRQDHLAGYTVTEEYVIRSKRFNKSAAMTVETGIGESSANRIMSSPEADRQCCRLGSSIGCYKKKPR
jgi:hypothetical protein